MNEHNGQNWRLITGDCLTVLDTIADGSARLVFADPPYNLGVDYGSGKKADRLPKEEFVGWCRN